MKMTDRRPYSLDDLAAIRKRRAAQLYADGYTDADLGFSLHVARMTQNFEEDAEREGNENVFVKHCDFCGKLESQAWIFSIESKYGSHICEECVSICVDRLEK